MARELPAARAQAAEAAGTARALADLGPRRARRRVWHRGGHAAIEVRGLSGRGAGHHRVADAVRGVVRGLRGVRWAEVNAVTGHVLIAFDEGRISVPDLVGAVQDVEEAHGTAEEKFSWQRPDPSDDAPLVAAQAALAADLAGVAMGVAGQVLRLTPLAPGWRIPLAVLESYPRVRAFMEQSIGPIGTDVLLAVGNAAVYGLSDGPARGGRRSPAAAGRRDSGPSRGLVAALPGAVRGWRAAARRAAAAS